MTTAVIWILSLFVFCYVITRSTGIDKKHNLNIDFDDYKEKELGNIELPNDHKEF